MNAHKSYRLAIVTGLSGAGMSSALKTMEDLGFEVFDNFPLSLVGALLNDTQGEDKLIAIGVDSRARGFSPEAIIETAKTYHAQLIFMSCEDAILKRRFTETRRRHPLALNQSIRAGIGQERTLLAPVLSAADLTIDTSTLSIHDLKHILKDHFGLSGQNFLTCTLMSFGYKHGVPRTADIVMDVRFLKNPHWVEDLKDLTGKDAAVADYIRTDEGFAPFLEQFKALMNVVLPRYADEGKSYLTVAIGCTGGKHRSVFTVESLKSWLEGTGYQTYIEHRDMGK